MFKVPDPPGAACLRPVPGGCELRVQVVPNASRTSLSGLHDGTLRVRLAAPPIEGRANAALLLWLARSLGLPKRAVTLERGETSRLKRVRIEAEAARVAEWLAAQLGAAGPPDA